MHEILIEKTLDAPLSKVWPLLADFGNLDWYTPAEKVEAIGEGIGQIRRITMTGMGDPIDEILEAIDNEAHSLSYSIPGGVMVDYFVTNTLSANGDKTDLVLRGTFKEVAMEGLSAEDLIAIMQDNYSGMMDALSAAANKSGAQHEQR